MQKSFILILILTATLIGVSSATQAQLASARVDQIAREQKARYQQSGHNPAQNTLNPGNLNRLPSATVSTEYVAKKKKSTPKPIIAHSPGKRTVRDLPSNSPALAEKGHPRKPRMPKVN